MLECHYSLPAREKIGGMQKTGMRDQQIVDTFVKERGIVALAAPPMQGFNLLGWIMPFIVHRVSDWSSSPSWMKRFRQAEARRADSRRAAR